MSNLNFTYGSGTCKVPSYSYPIITPYINSLSSYYSVVGATTLITIFGNNFRDFSTVIFSNNLLTSIFVSSSQISFYVPTNYTYGTYTIQVFNDNLGSNVVNFTIDNNGTYWILSTANNSISNINTGGVNMNTSVFANFLNSYSIPGAYVYTTNNIGYPIFNSITSYSNIYSNSNSSSTNSSIQVGLCYNSSSKTISIADEDAYYIVFPGYQLIVKDTNSNITLQISNLSNKVASGVPSSLSNSSCVLYFWKNNGWNII